MQKYNGYEGLTKEQIKNKVLTGFYNTGRVNGYYMTKFSSSKENPLKYYISGWLSSNDTMCVPNTKDQYIEDFYQMLFLHLFKITDEKFCDGGYNRNGKWVVGFFKANGDLNVRKLCATACLIIQRQGFYKDKIKGYSNQSLITSLMHASSFNASNSVVNQIENFDEANIDEKILREELSIDGFVHDFSSTPDEITSQLSDEDFDLFQRCVGKKFNTKSPIMRNLAYKIKEIMKR